MVRRIARIERGPEAWLSVDGRAVRAHAGESLAAALAAAGILALRRSPTAGTPRGMFCLMGICQECVVTCDERILAACLEPVRDGMVVQLGGAGALASEGDG